MTTELSSGGRRLCSIVTRWSRLRGTGARGTPDWQEGWTWLYQRYQPAMRRYVYWKLQAVAGQLASYETAADIVQDWFTRAMERGWRPETETEVRSFRAYIQVQLQRATVSWLRSRGATKRGGGATHVGVEALDDASAEDDPAARQLDRGLVDIALERALRTLREHNERDASIIDDLLREQASGATSPDLPQLLGFPERQLPVIKHRARKRLRKLLGIELEQIVDDEASLQALWARLEPHLP